VEVISVIHRTLMDKWKKQGMNELQRLEAWNDYVPKHLLPRLYGYELMMAPYAIAHMKIGLKLAETGYRFGTEERARIYLTNALEPWQRQLKLPDFEALAHEATAVNEIKREKRFTVVIGNPPYSINSCNLQESAVAFVEPFRYVDGVKIQERGALKFETILQDDYVKFWGLGIRILESTPSGIISMISNNGFLTNRVLRGFRKTLLNHFNRLTFFTFTATEAKEKFVLTARPMTMCSTSIKALASPSCARQPLGLLQTLSSSPIYGETEAQSIGRSATPPCQRQSSKSICPNRPITHLPWLKRKLKTNIARSQHWTKQCLSTRQAL
jgi:hypothetical protein